MRTRHLSDNIPIPLDGKTMLHPPRGHLVQGETSQVLDGSFRRQKVVRQGVRLQCGKRHCPLDQERTDRGSP
jgi:hypothetical protein